MENVYGILTKYKGKVKERILHEINSIIDLAALEKYVRIAEDLANRQLNGEEQAAAKYCIDKLYISIDKAKSQALDYGHPLLRELGFLSVHGLLHLLG